MMQRSLTEELKYQFRYGGTTIRLLFVNIAVFLAIRLLDVLGQLSQNTIFHSIGENLFVLPGNFSQFLWQPWTLFTYMFAHQGFMHLLGNMLFLYFGGVLFQQLLGERKLFYTYLMGGIFGAVFQLLGNAFVPFFQFQQSDIIGASASVMAIIVALGVYRPNYVVQLFGIFPIKLMYIVLFFVVSDFLSLASLDNVGHLAHIGGALLGFLSVQKIHSHHNFMNVIEDRTNRFRVWLRKQFQPKPTFKMYRNTQGRQSNFRPSSDEEFLAEKKQKQEKVDAILDKISKNGYEALSKEEKQFLFQQNKE
jgi:membrane associated rhomboid family serine protease